MGSSSSTTSEMRYLPANNPTAELKLMLPRKEGHEYYVDHIGDQFYIRTNDKGKNFRLVTASVNDVSQEHWKERIAHRKEVMLEDIDCFAGHYVASERENGIPKIHITDLKSGKRITSNSLNRCTSLLEHRIWNSTRRISASAMNHSLRRIRSSITT